MKNYDYIIIGHGLAGATLANELLNHQRKVLVLDDPGISSCSKVAAGLFNPLVFKKLNKVWRADLFFPAADAFYQGLEKQYAVSLQKKIPLCRIFSSAGEQNDFQLLSGEDSYHDYIKQDVVIENHSDQLNAPFGTGIISGSGFLNTQAYLQFTEQRLETCGEIIRQKINLHKDLRKENNRWIVSDAFSAEKIVFSDGWKITENPFFSYLPMMPAKGDVLTIHAPELNENYIYNGGCFVLPIGNQLFRAGATFNWKDLSDSPTQNGKDELLVKLKDLLKVPFTITEHLAGVRPATKDRRPLLGEHPEHKGLFVFNGLGTRGVIMAPWLAQHFRLFAEEGIMLDRECDIQRFSGKN